MPETFIYITLAILAVSVLWGACELHLLRHRLDATPASRTQRRKQLSPQLFDQETQ